MKKKVRVDFSAHYSVVVEVEENDVMYENAAILAQQYICGNPAIEPSWEIDDGGVDNADDDDDVDVREGNPCDLDNC